MNVLSLAFNDTTFSLRSHRTGPYDYVTSLHLYYRGSQRGLGIYVGMYLYSSVSGAINQE